MATTTTRRKYTGSRPPPQKRPSTSSLSILFVMALVLVGAFVASGNLVPVDPNGPGGPPTIQPYYNAADYPKQHIVTPTGGFPGSKQNLQLETFSVDNCGQNSVIEFIIDTSGSMSYANKINNEKNALSYFTSNMGGLSAIGIITFGHEDEAKVELPLSYFKDVKPQVKKIIDGFTPDGGTPTKDAMELAYQDLKKSIENEDYPGYAYNVVLITDGVPEQMPPRTCYVQTYDPRDAPLMRCFAKDQDPTVPVNIPNEIRNLGVDVYAINVYSPTWASDAFMFPYLDHLLKDEVVSTPAKSHYFVSTNASNLSAILQSINNNICYDQLNGTGHTTKPTP